MKDTIRNLLALSYAERKGVIALVILIAIITGIQAYLSFHSSRDTEITDSLWIRELTSFEQQLTLVADEETEDLPAMASVEYEIQELFYFDPNTVSAVDLKRLGMSNRVIRTLINYRIKGGKFYTAEDLNRVYGMSPDLYVRLAPFIRIPRSEKPERLILSDKRRIVPMDINRADSSEFEGLSGIGPVIAKRIIGYRSLLGGFYDARQLKEVYGMEDSVVAMVSGFLTADTSALVRLNLNTATEQDLARHPYIGRYKARGIIKYRTGVKTINNAEELVVNGLVSEEEFERLKHYLGI